MRRGKGEEEGAPVSGLALHPDAAMVGLDDALDDGEPQPGAQALRLPGLPEALEEVRQILGGNSAARVAHPEQHVAFSDGRPDDETAARAGELEGVADQVLEDLQEPVAIGPDRGQLRRDLELELERGGSGERL